MYWSCTCFNLLLEYEYRQAIINKNINNLIDIDVLKLPIISNSTDLNEVKIK
jgi:hypothetical protein